MAAQEREKKLHDNSSGPGVLGVADCDIGSSPQMSKASFTSGYKKNPPGKMSPLGV